MTFRIETLGCKVNQYESRALAALLTERGHIESDTDCEVIVVNTCAVTGEASRKSRQMARRLKTAFPNAFLAVCGCAGGIENDWQNELGAVLVMGSKNRLAFVERLDAIIKGVGAQRVPEEENVFEILPPPVNTARTRASIKIQDGCDNFCAYCVIPYVRGRVRSMPPEIVASQARELAVCGYREIVITGIEISSYGYGGLLEAVRAVSENAPEARIRLSSLEPSSVTREFVSELARIRNICPHFHLSLQSGCDATLRRMRRKYDTEQFYNAVEILRTEFENCGITADIIAGFPGETDAEFDETLSFVKKCAFSGAHIFPYSVRPGTAAAKMSGKIPNAVKRERARMLRTEAERSKTSFLQSQIGKRLEILLETEKDGFSEGHAGNYITVRTAGTGLRGEIVLAEITGTDGNILDSRTIH